MLVSNQLAQLYIFFAKMSSLRKIGLCTSVDGINEGGVNAITIYKGGVNAITICTLINVFTSII